MLEGMAEKLLVIQVAALGHGLLKQHNRLQEAQNRLDMDFCPAESVFPAVTCTAQATFRTAAAPDVHGMVANGLYLRDLHKPMFWEQSADLVSGQRIWGRFREAGRTVGMLFWQQSLGEDVDVVLSPAPIHKHHGGMIMDCYSRPAGLYGRLCERVGRKFDLMHYWGPLAKAKVGRWIADAAAEVMRDADLAPDLLLTYLPTLDYDLQRYGPAHAKSDAALSELLSQLSGLAEAARKAGYDLLVWGDYAIGVCSEAVFPNRALAAAGLLETRDIRGMLYPDFHTSRAFAVVDHEVAHVYVRRPEDVAEAQAILQELPHLARVLDNEGKRASALDHPNAGELVLLAEQGRWLAYPWWEGKRQAPDYARHIDIHNKPGYDPCELYFGWPPMSVSQDAAKIRGSHGRTMPGREIAWASTLDLGKPANLVELANAVREWLNS